MSGAELGAALIEFNREAAVYCGGISDGSAQVYALEYARMIENRAKGLETDLPKPPHGVFEPNRKLIRSALDEMRKRYSLAR